jgi:hypothetical protein
MATDLKFFSYLFFTPAFVATMTMPTVIQQDHGQKQQNKQQASTQLIMNICWRV